MFWFGFKNSEKKSQFYQPDLSQHHLLVNMQMTIPGPFFTSWRLTESLKTEPSTPPVQNPYTDLTLGAQLSLISTFSA